MAAIYVSAPQMAQDSDAERGQLAMGNNQPTEAKEDDEIEGDLFKWVCSSAT